MKWIFWGLLLLFAAGNAFFVLPWHWSSDNIRSTVSCYYKKDDALLKAVFLDSPVAIRPNLAPAYDYLYQKSTATGPTLHAQRFLFVNLPVSHDLDFTAIVFPFYKVASFNGVVPFYSVIKTGVQSLDSVALVGNITVTGKLTVKGICTPLYARSLVEKEIIRAVKSQMADIEKSLNMPPDTSAVF